MQMSTKYEKKLRERREEMASAPRNISPIRLFTNDGKEMTQNRGNRVANLAAHSVNLKGVGVHTVTVEFLRGDAWDFLTAYSRNRHESIQEIGEFSDLMRSGNFIEAYPSLAFDWNGSPVNGRTTMLGFLMSEVPSIRLVVTLGVNPEMGVRIDTGKRRGQTDQASYLPGDPLAAIPTENAADRVNCITASSYIYGLLCEYGQDQWTVDGHSFTRAKNSVCKDEKGQEVVHRVADPFVEIMNSLTALEKDGDLFAPRLRKAVWYVPHLVAKMVGDQDIIDFMDRVASNDGLRKGTLAHRMRGEIVNLCGEKGQGHTGRREAEEVKRSIAVVMSYMHAAALGLAKPLVIPPRYKWDRDKDGTPILVKINYNKPELKGMKALGDKNRDEIFRYFFGQIK